ncbi:MAG TPA: hypothetical protein VII92_20755, partial [Anaerolineae bacterium]
MTLARRFVLKNEEMQETCGLLRLLQNDTYIWVPVLFCRTYSTNAPIACRHFSVDSGRTLNR